MSPSPPSGGGGPGAPLRPAGGLSARRWHLRASCPVRLRFARLFGRAPRAYRRWLRHRRMWLPLANYCGLASAVAVVRCVTRSTANARGSSAYARVVIHHRSFAGHVCVCSGGICVVSSGGGCSTRVNSHTSVGGGSGRRRGLFGSTHSHIRGGEAASIGIGAADAAVAVALSATRLRMCRRKEDMCSAVGGAVAAGIGSVSTSAPVSVAEAAAAVAQSAVPTAI